MHDVMTLQGRQLTRADIDFIRQLIAEHPKWSRRQLSIALSTAWQWRNAKGVLKDMACRSLAVKLHEREYIQLSARRQIPTSRMAKSCVSRDLYIGWDSSCRQRNLQLTTNNTRFLIFPWVRVPHLASHILVLISRRISVDWLSRYGHNVYLLETFVDQARRIRHCN